MCSKRNCGRNYGIVTIEENKENYKSKAGKNESFSFKKEIIIRKELYHSCNAGGKVKYYSHSGK